MINKVLLLILDGYGINPSEHGNAIAAAKKPTLDSFFNKHPQATLEASGLSVGLPEGIMGNSEVGHLNIGAGRIVYQLNTLIDKKIETGEFYENQVLKDAILHAKENSSKLHLFGLLSDGNVHSNNVHLWALLELCSQMEFSDVYLHAFMDGRDTLPHSGMDFIKEFLQKSKQLKVGNLATISGRYYAMDRDNRWERIEKAYNAIVHGKGRFYENPVQAMQESYDENITDEFIDPTVITNADKPTATVQDSDSIIFFNFRADRARELTQTFINPEFEHFETESFEGLKYTTFSQYDKKFSDRVPVAFSLPELKRILGEEISNADLRQLRLAETEKYAHVTFFFNGGVENPYPQEDRVLVPSPKIATYDLQPEMNAFEVKDELIKALEADKYSFIVTNFANCDMVGHTGVFDAAKAAVEAVDKCLAEIIPIAQKKDYNIIITADHGNAEKMLDENENVFTAHSTNPVPIVVALNSDKKFELNDGILADIAPTILHLMGVDIPKEMTGRNLIKYKEA